MIEIENRKYLFDTGYSATCVLENAYELGNDLKNINGIILSHGHYDHTNGLQAILEYCGKTSIYAHPDVFCDRYSLRNEILEFSGMKLSKDQLLTGPE